VLGADGSLLGVVSVRALEREAGDLPPAVGALAESVPEFHPEQPLAIAVDWLTGGDREGLPILSSDGPGIIGWLEHRDVLRAIARAQGNGEVNIVAAPREPLSPGAVLAP
jgi:CBS domain-containing protein